MITHHQHEWGRVESLQLSFTRPFAYNYVQKVVLEVGWVYRFSIMMELSKERAPTKKVW